MGNFKTAPVSCLADLLAVVAGNRKGQLHGGTQGACGEPGTPADLLLLRGSTEPSLLHTWG